MRIKQGVCGFAALLASSTALAGCGGEGGNESVFLYIINGYPGTSSMSILGPSGTIASDVRFGDRMGSDGPCGPDDNKCLPIQVDRQLGSDWTYRLEGMVEPAEVEKDLFAMYPQETGTMVMTRRSDESEVETTLFRHVQTISSGCTISVTNGLSVTNDFLPEDWNNFSITPEFKREPVEFAGYLDETEQQFTSECGPLPLGTDDHNQLARANLLEEVRASPWFFPVECTDTDLETVFCYGWTRPGVDGWGEMFPDGQVLSPRNTPEYYKCIESAISIRQPEDEMGEPQPFPDENAQAQCPPPDEFGWDDVQVDFQQVATCGEMVTRQVELIEPGAEDQQRIYGVDCDLELRIRNPGQQIVFGPEGSDERGKHQDGDLVTSNIEISGGSQHFYVLLGRPVNPILWQWDSGGTFVDLKDFDYPNDQLDRVGDYDFD